MSLGMRIVVAMPCNITFCFISEWGGGLHEPQYHPRHAMYRGVWYGDCFPVVNIMLTPWIGLTYSWLGSSYSYNIIAWPCICTPSEVLEVCSMRHGADCESLSLAGWLCVYFWSLCITYSWEGFWPRVLQDVNLIWMTLSYIAATLTSYQILCHMHIF